MSDVPGDVQTRVAVLVRPTVADLLRAKQAIVDRLVNGGPVNARDDLLFVLVDAEGMPRYSDENRERLHVPHGGDPQKVIDPSETFLVRARLLLAARRAIAELANEGMILAVEGPENVYVTVPIQMGNFGTSVRVSVDQPALGSGYAIDRRVSRDVLGILDVDLFTAEMTALNLDARALLALREALQAYRRGLFLSCVTLLGAVSEGAWYTAGERLRGRSSDLDKALDDDNTATVIRLVAAEIAQGKRLKTTGAELYSHAAYLRDLRNYGVHPRAADPGASQEHAFSEAGCALLLLMTHRYLERLANAVDQIASPP